MTWAVYAQLTGTSPPINAGWLMEGMSRLFGDHPEFALKQTNLPFSRFPSVDSMSGPWLARLTYEEGEAVLADSIEIQRLTQEVRHGPELSTRRIRAVFSTDETGDYVNHAIWVMDFLQSIPSASLFDVTRKEYF